MQRVLRTLIVDDEPIARQVLRDQLEAFAGVELVGEAENGSEALEKISEVHPDLVLLDLQMPVMDGFQVIEHLRGQPLPVVVIVTAYNEHAIRAFENGAVDYLLKPVSEERLNKAVERVRAITAGHDNTPRVRKVVARSGGDFVLLEMDEVLAFQADGELVWIVTATDRLLGTESLRAIEEKLRDHQFQRVHRNAIVNLNHIRKLTATTSHRWMITLSNSLQLVASKRLARNVRGILRW